MYCYFKLSYHCILLCPLHWNIGNLLDNLNWSPSPWLHLQFSRKFRRNELMQHCWCLSVNAKSWKLYRNKNVLNNVTYLACLSVKVKRLVMEKWSMLDIIRRAFRIWKCEGFYMRQTRETKLKSISKLLKITLFKMTWEQIWPGGKSSTFIHFCQWL